MNLSDRYLALKSALIDSGDIRSEQFSTLLNYIENETQYLDAPASTKYHCSYKHGLLEHSVNVTEVLIRLNKSLGANLPISSCIFVGLCHDCGKSEQYIMKDPTPKQIQYGYPGSIVYADEESWMEHSTRSLKIVSKFVDCTDDEWAAIAYHNEPHNGTLSEWRETKMGLLLQYADYYATRFMEVTGEEKSKSASQNEE